MELRWLQDFLMVAETGNFTRAAEKRNTSQAAFSRRIKSLEAWLGFDLIDRRPHPTLLTPQGEVSANMPAQLLRQMPTAAVSSAAALGRNEHGPHRLAVRDTAPLPHWWQALARGAALSWALVVVGNIHDLITAGVGYRGPDDLLPSRATADPSLIRIFTNV